MQGNIKVVVRCRPLNTRELARGATCLVKMEGNQTILQNPKSNDDIKAFTFDRSYWSAGNKTDSDYADQETVYNDVGREWLNHAFDGYNCCIFAYGQTGSGKSFSMMGYGADKGIIPRTCSDLFDRIHQLSNGVQQFQVEVSYIEIYNERVRDLLNPRTKHLKVREHPSLGPYVEDLSRLVVNSFDDIEHLMDEGNKARTVAATNMNETSSRSHAVFTIILTQKTIDEDKSKQPTEKVSRFSERANSTGASGMRLKEGANINRSLTTLGKVIAGLAEQTTSAPTPSSGTKSNKKRDSFIPYRDSVLTWLLKDSLGGNSKTAMIAAISPADFDETLSTLRYADQAKKIKTKAVVNEDPSVRLIRELKSEIQTLKQSLLAYVPHPEQLQQHGEEGETDGSHDGATINTLQDGNINSTIPVLPSKSILITDAFGNATELTKRQVVEQLKSSQKLLGDIDQSWDDRLQTTIQIQKERERALVELGITVAKNNMGVYTPKNTPHLVNLNEDPLMSECLMYQIKPGTTWVSRRLDDDVAPTVGDNDDKKQYIRLSGSNIMEDHCRFENVDEMVTLYPTNQAVTMVNGIHINEPKQLKSGYRIILGDYHVFRFNHPEEARREREQQQQQQQQPTSGMISMEEDNIDSFSNDIGSISAATATSTGEADWLFARREAVMHYFQQQQQYAAVTDGFSPTSPTVFENLTNDELEKLFDDVTKMRKIRKRQSSHSGSGLSQPMSPCSSNSSFSFRHSATPSTVSTILYENSGFYGSASSADDTESMVDREIIRLAREELQQQLDVQKVKYEKRIQRLSCLYPVATTKSTTSSIASLPLSSIEYSAEEMLILDKVMHHWQDQRYVHLAETLLMNGITLYEANALSRQLDKKITYQMIIIHNTHASGSAFEDNLFLASRIDKTLLLSRKPCVGVRVIDSKHHCTYLWSLDRLKTRLRYMQGIRFVTDQTHHLVANGDGSTNNSSSDKKIMNGDGDNGDELDLFYDSHPPRFTLIGMAKMPLRHLALHVPIERTLDVFCQSTCCVVGQLTVLIAPIARSKERQLHGSTSSTSISETINDNNMPVPTSSSSQRTVTADSIKLQHDALQVGQRLVFEIRVGTLSGVNEADYSDIHAQFQLDSFNDTEQQGDDDQIYTTSCINEFDESSSIDFRYSKAFSMVVTDNMLAAIQRDDLTFEIYGQPKAAYLKTLQQDEQLPCMNDHQQQQLPSVEKKHNVYAWVEICELAQISGEYTPVQVYKPVTTRMKSRLDANADEAIMTTPTSPSTLSHLAANHPQGTFILRQGQQRRIILTLRHDWVLPSSTDNDDNSGDGLFLDGMDGLVLWIGTIRCRSLGETVSPATTTPAQDLSIPLSVISNTKDTLVLQGAWDSSLHNSLLLNRLTDPGHTVDLTIKWVFHGAPFQMDLGVQITSGTLSNGPGLVKRQSLLRNIFTSSSTKSRNNYNKKRTSKDSTNDMEEEQHEEEDGVDDDPVRQDKKKTSVIGIYRVWERPRRLTSYFIHQQTNTEHYEWQQRQMEKIKTYDQARRAMMTKLEVANTRYTLALWDLLQHRHMSRGRRFSVLMDNTKDQPDEQQQQQEQQQQIPQQRLVDCEDRLHTIVQQWMDSKHQESTGLQLINAFGSPDQPPSSPIANINMNTPLYDIHQIALSDEQPGKNGFLMLQQYGYMKIRKLENDNDTTEKVSRWTKRWFLLKRPYLLIYANDLETNELDILNIQAVRVNPPVNDLVNTFTIYTTINTYQCQTANQSEMKEWVASMI
ncbi:hypothetical protein BC941DRAFT_447346 [Chlamydoabsidia padenii]|nr:hypothetical protein BC941DRAFT_447346 [Chlamydoabsidia padenii]